MMEATPAASFVVSEPDLQLEFLIVTLDAPAQLGEIDQLLKAKSLRQRGEPVFGRSDSPSGRSINSHSGDSLSGISLLYPTGTRTRAKREDSWPAEPSRHVTGRQARFGRPSATFLRDQFELVAAAGVFIGLCIRRGRSQGPSSRWAARYRPRKARPISSCLQAGASRPAARQSGWKCFPSRLSRYTRPHPSTRRRVADRSRRPSGFSPGRSAAWSCVNMICFGVPAFFPPARSFVQASGRYSR
ncbi:hypothetical protein ACVWXN_006842 [Bradyrhizobium sp. i1.4.4]